jgi:hypothetical protein
VVDVFGVDPDDAAVAVVGRPQRQLPPLSADLYIGVHIGRHDVNRTFAAGVQQVHRQLVPAVTEIGPPARHCLTSRAPCTYMHVRFSDTMLVSPESVPKDDMFERRDNYYVYLKPFEHRRRRDLEADEIRRQAAAVDSDAAALTSGIDGSSPPKT